MHSIVWLFINLFAIECLDSIPIKYVTTSLTSVPILMFNDKNYEILAMWLLSLKYVGSSQQMSIYRCAITIYCRSYIMCA